MTHEIREIINDSIIQTVPEPYASLAIARIRDRLAPLASLSDLAAQHPAIVAEMEKEFPDLVAELRERLNKRASAPAPTPVTEVEAPKPPANIVGISQPVETPKPAPTPEPTPTPTTTPTPTPAPAPTPEQPETDKTPDTPKPPKTGGRPTVPNI